MLSGFAWQRAVFFRGATMTLQSPQRALFLFDGPNFYKNMRSAGLQKGHLDYRILASNLAGPRLMAGVIFFTSPTDQITDPVNYANQLRFLERLKTSGVTLKLGKLVQRNKVCPSCNSTTIIKVEKSLDVQIAMEIVLGCVEDRYDILYLATCDSDLVPAIEFVRSKGKDVFLLWPEGSPCHSVSRACRVTIPIKQATLDAAQSPI